MEGTGIPGNPHDRVEVVLSKPTSRAPGEREPVEILLVGNWDRRRGWPGVPPHGSLFMLSGALRADLQAEPQEEDLRCFRLETRGEVRSIQE